MTVQITHFTDPACPFAFSAEPIRLRLRWHYGEGLRWRTRMIVLTEEPGEAEKLAAGAPGLQRLRRLRIRRMAGGLLDNHELLHAAARDVGLDPALLREWTSSDETQQALRDDMRAARSPSDAARALDHKLGGPREERRYTAPSYELARTGGTARSSIPGFNPIEAYEAAIANLAPELERREKPESVEEVLAWAGEPHATAEVAAIAQAGNAETRAALARVARPLASGADSFWTPADADVTLSPAVVRSTR